VLLAIYARRMARNDHRLANDDGPDDDLPEASP